MMKERERILSILSRTPAMDHDHPNFHHGRLKHYPPHNSDPRVTLRSHHTPRHSMTPWLTSSQYQDRMRVLQDKVQYLTRLIICSTRTLVVTGSNVGGGRPGTSRSRSVDTRSSDSGHGSMLTQVAVSCMIRRGLVQHWIQLTPECLAQRAGCLQTHVTDVHGSWYDPSNPVVKSSGCIRGDVYERMLTESLSADLTLALGTSLSGMYSVYFSQELKFFFDS